MAEIKVDDALEMVPLRSGDLETGSDERREEIQRLQLRLQRRAATTDPATAGAESEEGGGGGAGDGVR